MVDLKSAADFIKKWHGYTSLSGAKDDTRCHLRRKDDHSERARSEVEAFCGGVL